MNQKKILLVILLLLLIAFFTKGLFFAAMVNGKPVSRIGIIKDLEKRGGKQTLDSLISKELILQEASRKKIIVKKEEVDKKIKDIEKSTSKQGQKLDQLLAVQGMTKEDLGNQMEVQLILEKLLADKIKVSEKEIEAFIEKNTPTESLSTSQPINPPTKNEARDQLRQQKLQKEAQTLVEQLKKDAKISYFVNY